MTEILQWIHERADQPLSRCFQRLDTYLAPCKIDISQESSDSRLARPKAISYIFFSPKGVRPMTNLLKGGTGDGKGYHNVRSTDPTCNHQHQKSRQFT